MRDVRDDVIGTLRTEIHHQGSVIQRLPEGNPVRTAYLHDIVVKRRQIDRLRSRQLLDLWLTVATLTMFGGVLTATAETALMILGGLILSVAVALVTAHALSGQ